MAALGAGAGAFEGDNERAKQRADMARLSLHGAQLAQGDRQFYEQTKLARERMASAEAENAAQRRENADALALRQKNIDRQFAFDEKQFQAGRENDAYQRGRNERQDAWREALNAQEIMEKQERIKTNRLQFEELDRAAKMEREKFLNRRRLAKTGLGALALSAFKNGGIVSPAALEVFNKQQEAAGTGIRVTGGVWSKEGFFFWREGPAVDQNGQPIQGKMAEYGELMNPAIARAIIKDEYGEDIAEEQSSAQRESAKYENAKDIASLRGQRATRFDANRLEAIDTDIYEYENGLKVKGLAPEEKARLEGQLKAAKEFRRSLIYGGEPNAAVYSAYGETLPAPSGAQVGYTEQQINELGGLKVQALREANGDKAKALDIFKQKKKQWELSQVNPDGSAATQRQAQPAELKPIQEPDMTTSRFARLNETAKPGTATPAQDGSMFGRKHDFGSSSGNAPPSVSSTLRKNEPNTDLSPEDKEAMAEIYLESQKNPIDPVTRLPIDPVEYRRIKEAEYFKAKRDADQKQMKELFEGR